MTAVLEHTRVADVTWTIGAPRLLAGLKNAYTLDYEAHLAVHGPLPRPDAERLLALLEESGLAGRGGAGFPFATKLRSLRGVRPTIIVNGSESEPASTKDRTLMRRTPHLVLDGALAADVAAVAQGNHHAVPVAHRHSELVVGRGACAHPDGTSRFVSSGLAALHHEIVAHRTGGCGRIDRGQLPTGPF